MKDLPYFRWFTKDAQADEAYSAMNDTELGFFHRCLNRSWDNNGLPSDLDELARLMHVTREHLDSVWPRVGRCWHEQDGRMFNNRQEREREHAMSKSAKASQSVRMRKDRSTNVPTDDLRSYNEGSTRAYASASVSESSSEEGVQGEKTAPTMDRMKKAYEWFKVQFPGEVNDFMDYRLFLSVMETNADLDALRGNLPKWKLTRKWQDGFHPTSKNFLSERIFHITPKPDRKDARRGLLPIPGPIPERSAQEEIAAMKALLESTDEPEENKREYRQRLQSLGVSA